jgi:hypothetical protein
LQSSFRGAILIMVRTISLGLSRTSHWWDLIVSF